MNFLSRVLWSTREGESTKAEGKADVQSSPSTATQGRLSFASSQESSASHMDVTDKGDKVRPGPRLSHCDWNEGARGILAMLSLVFGGFFYMVLIVFGSSSSHLPAVLAC